MRAITARRCGWSGCSTTARARRRHSRTFTDVSFEDFGEGSFDKGITIDIPLGSIAGNATRQTVGATLRPPAADGGATLNVDGRLNALVSDYHGDRLEDTRGMVWR